MSIEKISTYCNFDAEYLKGCEKSLALRDFDNDGKTTADEMILNNNQLFIAQFGGQNAELATRASNLAARQAEIFRKYAGEDNVFTPEEHASCINSEEWVETIEAYHKLEAEKWTYLQEQQNTAESGYKDNGNGEETGFFKKISNAINSLFEKFFGGAKSKAQQVSQKYKLFVKLFYAAFSWIFIGFAMFFSKAKHICNLFMLTNNGFT